MEIIVGTLTTHTLTGTPEVLSLIARSDEFRVLTIANLLVLLLKTHPSMTAMGAWRGC